MLLITGITGLTGRFLYREIQDLAPDEPIKYLVRTTSDTSFLNEEQLVYADVSDWQHIAQVLDDVDVIIHIAHISNSENIIKACQEKGVKRVIFINTTGMFSKYKAYAKDYIEYEKAIKSSGLIYTIIRPTMIYGNNQDVNIKKLVFLMDKLKFFPVIGKGNGLMQPIYAHDLAKVILSAYINEEVCRFKEYNVAGKEPISYINLLRSIASALGKKRYFIHIPYSLALLVGRIGDIIPNGLIDYEKVQRLLEDKNFDYSEATRDFRFQPLAFEDGVRHEVDALRKGGFIK